jgi:hypothetical protein
MATGLTEAIVALLDSNAGLLALMPDGIWSDESPEGETLPYLVLIERPGDREYESADETNAIAYVETNRYQVSIFAASKDQVRSIGNTVAAALTDATLTFDSGHLLLFRVNPRHSEKDPQPGPDGSDVWQMILMFDAMVESTL